jgi:lambda family phage portal protein
MTRAGALRTRRPVSARPGAPARVPRLGAEAYQAASTSHPDLRRWTPLAGSADADLLDERGTIASRSRDLTRNHGIAESALQTQVDNIIGTGLKLVARPNYRALGRTIEWARDWSREVEALWASWANRMDCDAGNSLTFDGLTTLVFRGAWQNGDGLALPLWLPHPRRKFGTRLQVIEADRLCNPFGRQNTERMRDGIEVDEYGAPLAYWVRKTHPGDSYGFIGAATGEWERIPAETEWGRRRVVHLHNKDRAGQSRGVPALASVMRQFKVLGDLTNAELKATAVNAFVALVSESSLSEEALVELLSSDANALKAYQESLDKRGSASIDFNAGQILNLGLGEKFSAFTPGRPSTSFEPFVTMLFRHIAAGLNMPYELLLKDFSKTNYSSARAALLEAWRFFSNRRLWLGTYWATPIYELWLEEAVNAGMVEAPDFYGNFAYYAQARWIGAGRGWIDPLKEANATQLRMQSGMTTLEFEQAEQGQDWEETLEQQAYELARRRELGLDLAPTPAPAPAANVPRAETADDDEPADDDDADPAADENDPPEDARAAQITRLQTALIDAVNRPLVPPTVHVAAPQITVNPPGPTEPAAPPPRQMKIKIRGEAGDDEITVDLGD